MADVGDGLDRGVCDAAFDGGDIGAIDQGFERQGLLRLGRLMAHGLDAFAQGEGDGRRGARREGGRGRSHAEEDAWMSTDSRRFIDVMN